MAEISNTGLGHLVWFPIKDVIQDQFIIKNCSCGGKGRFSASTDELKHVEEAS